MILQTDGLDESLNSELRESHRFDKNLVTYFQSTSTQFVSLFVSFFGDDDDDNCQLLFLS